MTGISLDDAGRKFAGPLDHPNRQLECGPDLMDTLSDASSDQSSAVSQFGQRQLFGTTLVVMSATAIAIVPTFAKLAYDGGSDTLTVITARSIVTAAICILVMIILGRPLNIARHSLAISLALGLLYAAHLYGLLRAVAYLPVNMVILIYYLHPLYHWGHSDFCRSQDDIFDEPWCLDRSYFWPGPRSRSVFP